MKTSFILKKTFFVISRSSKSFLNVEVLRSGFYLLNNPSRLWVFRPQKKVEPYIYRSGFLSPRWTFDKPFSQRTFCSKKICLLSTENFGSSFICRRTWRTLKGFCPQNIFEKYLYIKGRREVLRKPSRCLFSTEMGTFGFRKPWEACSSQNTYEKSFVHEPVKCRFFLQKTFKRVYVYRLQILFGPYNTFKIFSALRGTLSIDDLMKFIRPRFF